MPATWGVLCARMRFRGNKKVLPPLPFALNLAARAPTPLNDFSGFADGNEIHATAFAGADN